MTGCEVDIVLSGWGLVVGGAVAGSLDVLGLFVLARVLARRYKARVASGRRA